MPGNDYDRADQMNPNNDTYWQSRGFDGRPDDLEDRLEDEDGYDYIRANQMNLNSDVYCWSRGDSGPY